MGWLGEPEDAVGILADTLAAEFAIDPNQPVDTIHLTISGVNSVVAYGRVQRLMENLRIVDKIMISKVAADKISYDVEVQGGVERLNSALLSSGLLEAVELSGVIDANPYRMNRRPFGPEPYRPDEPRTLDFIYRTI